MSSGPALARSAAPGPDATRPRRHPVWRRVGAVVGWLGVLLALVGLAAHVQTGGRQALILLAAGAWTLTPGAAVGLVLTAWRRAWWSAVVAAAVVVVEVVVYAPLFVAQSAPAGGAEVRVMTQNMLYGHADPAQIVDRVRAEEVDVLMLEELTPEAAAAVAAAGLLTLLPHRWEAPGPDGDGSGLFSRYPLTDVREFGGFGAANASARLTLPGGSQVTVGVVHLASPFPGDPAQWSRELPLLQRELHAVAAGPAIVAGDFNATTDHAPFRALLTDGYADGAAQAGAGFVRSWPANRFVPVIGIDHVLTRGAVATTFETVQTDGTDHRGVLATVVVPH